MDASDWMKGIFFSVLASIVGAGSKLAIRKSWLMEHQEEAAAESMFVQEAQAADQEGYRGPTLEELNQQQHSSFRQDDDLVRNNSMQSNPNEPDEESSQSRTIRNSSNRNKNYKSFQQSSAASQGDVEQGNRPRGRSIYTAVQPGTPERNSNDTSSCSGVDDGIAPTEMDGVDQEDLDLIGDGGAASLTYSYRWCVCLTLPLILRGSGVLGMMILNPLFCLLAMNYASPSILAPFSGLTLVWVIVLSMPLIGEQPSCSQRVACFLIVLGEVMVAIFGDHTNDDDSSIQSVADSYKDPAFWTFYGGVVIYMVCCYIWVTRASNETLRQLAWGTSGGIISGLAQGFIKDTLTVFKLSPSVWKVPIYMPLFFVMAVVFVTSGLFLLTACMKRYDATYTAAMYVGSFVVSTSAMSAVHYHTFDNLTDTVDKVMYPMGLLMLMLGVSVLIRGSQASVVAPGTMPHREDADRIMLSDDSHHSTSNHHTDIAMADNSEGSLRGGSPAMEKSTTVSTRTSLTEDTSDAAAEDMNNSSMELNHFHAE